MRRPRELAGRSEASSAVEECVVGGAGGQAAAGASFDRDRTPPFAYNGAPVASASPLRLHGDRVTLGYPAGVGVSLASRPDPCDRSE